MRKIFKRSCVLGVALMVCVGVHAEKFVGTDIEDPESKGRLKLLERGYQKSEAIVQSAARQAHALGLSKQAKLIMRLQESGIQVILLGNNVRIIIPSRVFFEPGTTNIRQDRAEAMTTLYDFIARYPASPIEIVGHSDFLGTKAKQKRYSLQVARVVSGYLWANGLQESRFSIQGVGAESPVTDSVSGSLNSRVEISFRDMT